MLANSFDADANNVEVIIYSNNLGGTEKIEIIEDGTGILDDTNTGDEASLRDAIGRKFKETGFSVKYGKKVQ